MIKRKDHDRYRAQAAKMLEDNSIKITDEEYDKIEILDFGQSRFEEIGLAMLVYFNSERACARELILFPHQTIAEQIHPDVNGVIGKEETFRVQAGKVYVYIEGEPTENPKCQPPKGREAYYKCRHEIELNPCDQFTMLPNMHHWLQAGPEGAVILEVSTVSDDETDLFTDPEVERFTVVTD